MTEPLKTILEVFGLPDSSLVHCPQCNSIYHYVDNTTDMLYTCADCKTEFNPKED